MKLHIEKLIYGGAGLARHDGKAIFIPFTLPGELIEARTIEDRRSYATAELVHVIESAPHRAHPPCPYFSNCGGCHYQHIAYQQQLNFKSQILRESLERANLVDIPQIDMVRAEPFGYRNRLRLHIDRTSSKLCYKRASSHRNLAVDACPIAALVLENSLQSFQSNSQAWQLGPTFSEIELFTNSTQDSILLSLWTSDAAHFASQKFNELWPQMQAQISGIVGAALFSAKHGNQSGKLLAHAGDQSLSYTSSGRQYRVSLGSFFQVNRCLIDPLVNLVVGHASGTVAWDLYAGVGLFSVALAARFDHVVAVESAPVSVGDLRHNLKGNQHRVIASSALDFLRRACASQQRAPDLVVVDPPRTGLGKEVTTLLAAARAPNITYISCDPATLSRDLKSLLDSGYGIRSICMVDLFPQTFHLESVVMLSLN
jgi:23S rRNA (uracil1939-C5)-methyltransferase